MLYGANVVIYAEKNAQHINTERQNVKFLIVKLIGASRKQ
jgi:hypothetical protein